MKINVKPFDCVKGANKIHFDGVEVEMSVEEIAMYYENMDKVQEVLDKSLDKFANKMNDSLEKAKAFEKESHEHRMEYLKQQDENDAAYMQRRKDQEVMEHQHWLEKYGKEDNED